MDQSDIYTEKLMNMILDAITDIIVIHDAEHNIIWMNRAGEKAFGMDVDDVIGKKCYALFGHTLVCDGCKAHNVMIGEPTNRSDRRVIEKTGIECDCYTMPYFKNGKLEMVVQRLTPITKGN